MRHQPAIHTWRRRYTDVPGPVAHLRPGGNCPDVERWARKTGQLK